MDYATVDLFPTTIYVGNMDGHEEYKKQFYKLYSKFDYEETNYISTVSENSGNPLIHLEESLNPLFDEIISHVKNYAHDVLKLKDIFDFVITKTWLSRARKSEDEIRWHIHSTSHISFSYYVNMPENCHSINFSNQHCPNDLFLGMSSYHEDDNRVMIKEYNSINSEKFFLKPNEGNILLFPSKTVHCTQSEIDNFVGERLAIVGDVILTLKEQYLSHSMGYIDQKYWRTYK
jgi:uncharacterized protein (TIGR02466 family)